MVMRKTTKAAAVVATFVIFTAGFSTIAQAAPTKSPAKVNCKKTNAKGHSVKNITPPEVKTPFKNRTFTLKTNCGEIVIEADGVKAPVTVIALAALANGGFYNQTPYSINNTQVVDMGVTAGFAFFIPKTLSQFNFSFTYVNRGLTLSSSEIKEHYLRFTLGVNINDVWFLKHKVD
mgnify:CR=1 FL=1